MVDSAMATEAMAGESGGPPCPFCGRVAVVHANALAFSCWDIAPVSPGHLLIVTARHVPDFLAITPQEFGAIWELAQKGKELIQRRYHPDGYNLGVNVGQAAGQTVAHAHLHLMPRYRGDVDHPRGGVRAVLPNRRAEPG